MKAFNPFIFFFGLILSAKMPLPVIHARFDRNQCPKGNDSKTQRRVRTMTHRARRPKANT